MNFAPASPSTILWSIVRQRVIIGLIAISPFTTTGLSTVPDTPNMAELG